MTTIPRRRAVSLIAFGLGGGLLASPPRLGAWQVPSTGGAPDDEAFWTRIRSGFDLPPGMTNLDNAAYGPPPRTVLDDLVRYIRDVEQLPATRLGALYRETTAKIVMPRLAALLAVPRDEIAMVRNATEALQIVVQGVPLSRGDEVVCSAHDFWTVLDALEQRRQRDGIVLRIVRPPVPAASLADLTQLYAAAITPRTRLVVVTHASNVTGQLYPVRQIADVAHKAGAEVLVDAAQTFALLPHAIPDLDCDYYAASLHKWLLAPIGSGVLWMRKALAANVSPLFPPWPGSAGMVRFMAFGTYPEPLAAAAAGAIEFHEQIGGARKVERLRYLTRYWRAKIERLPRVRFYTTNTVDASCALGIFEIEGVDSSRLRDHLRDRHGIIVRTMQDEARTPEIRGVRAAANVYTLTTDLDRFVGAIRQVVERGL